MQTQPRDPAPPEVPDETGKRDPSAKLENDPIMAELRKLYDGIVDEPVPDDLLELLRKLDEAERGR